MNDITEVLFVLAVMTYLFEHASDWVLSGALLFLVFCLWRFVSSAYHEAQMKKIMTNHHQRLDEVRDARKKRRRAFLERLEDFYLKEEREVIDAEIEEENAEKQAEAQAPDEHEEEAVKGKKGEKDEDHDKKNGQEQAL